MFKSLFLAIRKTNFGIWLEVMLADLNPACFWSILIPSYQLAEYHNSPWELYVAAVAWEAFWEKCKKGTIS